jgi:hypothetical protein
MFSKLNHFKLKKINGNKLLRTNAARLATETLHILSHQAFVADTEVNL